MPKEAPVNKVVFASHTSKYQYKPFILGYVRIPVVEIKEKNRSARPSRRKLSSMWIPELR